MNANSASAESGRFAGLTSTAELNVILDNSTRWNSTYDSIARAIQLYTAICTFQIENEAELGTDCLTREDWEGLRELAAFEAIQRAHRPPFNPMRLRAT